jgi:hypothetical protein
MAETTAIIRDKALNSPVGRFKLVTQLPQTPSAYYGGSYTLKDSDWRGGEIVYHNGTGTGANKLYIQTATSGTTPTWKRLLPQFITG